MIVIRQAGGIQIIGLVPYRPEDTELKSLSQFGGKTQVLGNGRRSDVLVGA
jgi:hypothetical protein